ncbi:fibronectin type III domain-containing protein [Microbulbifer epialgicus]|uniref:Fibronectin type III domain-containing protein n=1 Tax=Microbulbifer epialgicus TaxID=393907 RepID=A0ABV4NYD1_9GAMM
MKVCLSGLLIAVLISLVEYVQAETDQYHDLVINDSPVAYFPMDDNPDGTITDVMDLSLDLVSRDSPNFIELPRAIGGAVRFDGERQVLSLDLEDLDLTQHFSFELWVKFESLPSSPWGDNAVVFGPGESRGLMIPSYSRQHYLGKTKAGHVAFIAGNSDVSCALSDSEPVLIGELYHYAVSYDEENDRLSLYKNGQIVDSLDECGPEFDDDDYYSLGGVDRGDGFFGNLVDGFIADLAIYDRIISPNEILKHYESGSQYRLTDSDTVTIMSTTRIPIENQLYDGKSIVVDGVTLVVDGTHEFSNLSLENGANLTHSVYATQPLDLTVSGSIKIDYDSSIDVSGKGLFSIGDGSPNSGGSYGGVGGKYCENPEKCDISGTDHTNSPFGDYKQPFEFGVGGFGDPEFGGQGSRGGGAIKLTVGERLEVFGEIIAYGSEGSDFGGGSGGSIWIDASEIIADGSTLIDASGGGSWYGGSGSGGRVAVYYDSFVYREDEMEIPETEILNIVEDLIFSETGPDSRTYGGAGTVYLYDRSLPSNNAVLRIASPYYFECNQPPIPQSGDGSDLQLMAVNDNTLQEVNLWEECEESLGRTYLEGQIDGRLSVEKAKVVLKDGVSLASSITGASNEFSQVVAEGDLRVANDNLVVDGVILELARSHEFNSIAIQNRGKITTPSASESFSSGITLRTNNFFIGYDSSIDVVGKGYLPNDEVSNGAGGSYGGAGGFDPDGEGSDDSNPTGSTNGVYGNFYSPIDFGVGGRNEDDDAGVRGGGAIHIIADKLQLYGSISADGRDANGNYDGSGSGGSVFLDIGELVTNEDSLISANGGYSRYGGSGGGGRIAIYYESLGELDVEQVVADGGGVSEGYAGQGGSVHISEQVVRVKSVKPSGYIGESIANITIEFGRALDPDQLEVNDFELINSEGSPVTINSITAIDTKLYQVNFEQPLAEGSYTLKVGPNIFGLNGRGMDQDLDGIELEPGDDQFSTSLTIDVTPPQAPILDLPQAPFVNLFQSGRVTLSGDRENDTAIWLDGKLLVTSGSGKWSVDQFLPEGESTVTLTARDLSGNLSSSVSLKFLVDSKVPSVSGVYPSGLVNISPAQVTIVVAEEGSGIDLQNTSISIKRNNIVLAGTTKLYDGQLQYTPDAPFFDGDYEISAQIVDKVGNSSGLQKYFFTLDTTPPLPSVLDQYQSLTKFDTQTIGGSKEVDSEILINGTLIHTDAGEADWTTQVTLIEGNNNFSIVVRDEAGNESAPVQVNIRYDKTPPGPVAVTIDPEGTGTDLLLDWSAYDEFINGNDISEYRVYQSAGSFTDIAGKTPVAVLPQGSQQVRIEGLPRDTQAHFAVVAYDLLEQFNSIVTSIGTTPLDTQAPDEISNLTVDPGVDNLTLRWSPSPNSAGDLSGYQVEFVQDPDGRVDDIPLASIIDPLATVQYQVTGLSAATSYPLRISAYDGDGNVSAGISDSGTTLLPNPAVVSTEAQSNRIEVNWSSVGPYELLKHYSVYVEENDFTTISGLQPKVVHEKGIASDTEHTWAVAGLKNGTTYFVAVASVNISNGSNPVVNSVAVTPVAETDGPSIGSAQYRQGTELLDLTLSPLMTKDGNFEIAVSDLSGVARVEFYLNGNLLGTEYTANDNIFARSIALLSLADSEHALTVKAYDVWENVTVLEYPFSVALASPAAPQISSPAEGWLTNNVLVTIAGTAEKQTQVQVYRNGTPVGDIDGVDSYGKFQIEISLEEGENQITAAAEYPGRSGFGAQSAVRKINLDTTIPNAPGNVSVIERELGQISLSWDAVTSDDNSNQIAGYNVYRSSAAFTSVLEAERINAQLLTELKYNDLPAEDGHYFYAITAVNEAATEGSLSSRVEATADSEGPHALQVSYQSNGLVDSTTGRHGPGTIEVSVQFDEPLRNKPYFALAPDGGVPIAVELSKDYSDDTLYTGSFVIEPGMLSGTAYAVMSAHDNVGNRGTIVEQGTSLLIDAQGPEVIALALNPGEPLQVHEQDGLQVEVVLQLSDEVQPGAMPTLVPLVDHIAVPGLEEGIALNRDAQSTQGQPLWVGSFTLPTSAGRDEDGNPSVESLRFSFQALDDLDNLSDKIRVANNFQVYQGDLPPLSIPQNLYATALPGGEVALQWDAVEDARYVLYRKGESDADFIEIQRLSDTSASDSLPSDGDYYYGIASERRSNDQIAVSAMSAPVKVGADSIAPAIPTELALELNGAGIVATWQAPSADAQGNSEGADTLIYNLYRLNLAEGENATAETLQGIAPLQTGIPDTIALDAKPSESEHAYVITALDEAGNESAPSNTAYLNFGLLPVSDLSIRVDANGNPQLQWNHSGTAIAGYRIYVGEDDGLQEITSALIPHNGNPTSFVDGDYSAAEQGINSERRYTVVAEDSQGATSIGHSLLLPALSVEVVEAQEGESAIKRGVMNEVRFRVQNRGSGDISGVKLFASVSDNGIDRQHQSVAFSVAAGGLVEVPIVIGGYDKLDTLSDIQLRLEQSPLPGETVLINAADQVLVGDAALRLGLETDTLYRGGIGKVRFTLENTSAVESEVLVARNNGNAASDEVRVRIEDVDGNLLSLQSVQQFTGDVITVASGETVARMQPGETFVSDWIEVPIPAAAPDDVTIALEIDHFRYHTGKATQVVIEGNGTRTQASLQETAYYGELDSVTPAQVYGVEEKVTITGRALDRNSDAPMGNVPLSLVMELRGFERNASVITDTSGNFAYEFDPQGQSGNWRVSVIHPDSLGRPAQGAFAVLTSSVTPGQLSANIPRNYTQEMPITITAGHGTTLSDVRLVSVAAPDEEQVQIPSGLHLDLGAVIELAAQEKGVINLSLSGDNLAPEQGYLYFQVLASVNGIEQVLETLSLEYNLSESRPVIKSTPSFVDSGAALNGTTTETIQVKNTGFDALRNTTLTLVDSEQNPAPAWVRIDGTKALGDMAIGDSRDITIAFSPDNAVEQGNYEFHLLVEGDGGYSFTVQLFVAVVTSEIGNAFFHISDIYTATLGEDNTLIPGLSDAKIELQNEQVLSETRTINSDANGEAFLQDLPAGRYAYRVTAFDHESVSGRLWVKPGATVAEDVFLMNQIVSVEWQVNEINLEDRYEIKLEATFETQVPVAVVMLDPISVTLPDMQKGDVFTGELSLTNYGLIRAESMSGSLPTGNDAVSFEFLAEVPETLEAGEVVYIPYRITALRDFNPNEEGEASGAGCGTYSYQYQVSYQSRCANGQVVPGGTSTHWGTASYGSCGGGGSGGGGGYYYSGGSGSGGSYGGGYSPISSDDTLRCAPDPACDSPECNKDNSSPQ